MSIDSIKFFIVYLDNSHIFVSIAFAFGLGEGVSVESGAPFFLLDTRRVLNRSKGYLPTFATNLKYWPLFAYCNDHKWQHKG